MSRATRTPKIGDAEIAGLDIAGLNNGGPDKWENVALDTDAALTDWTLADEFSWPEL